MTKRKEKVAIVSSYSELCGNASYANALLKGFRDKFETVDVIDVNSSLLNQKNRAAYKQTIASEVDKICHQVSLYDFVNIQLEIGLYGPTHTIAKKVITKILNSCRGNILVTMHHIPDFEGKRLLKCLYEGALKESLKGYVRNKILLFFYRDILNILKKKNAEVIVHTNVAQRIVQHVFNYEKVSVFPITFLNKKERAYHRDNKSIIRQNFLKKKKLNPRKKYIGTFGFLTSNKGQHLLIKSLELLPKNYVLLVFGGQHPSTIVKFLPQVKEEIKRSGKAVTQHNNSTYISEVINLASKKGVDQRIKFYGAVDSHSELVECISGVDYVATPYYETGQNGSGIVSLALETSSKLITSSAIMFAELEKLYGTCFAKTTIGNYVEIAHKLEGNCFPSGWEKTLYQSLKSYNIENNIDLHARLFDNV